MDVAVTCRVLKVSRSGYYEWRHRGPSARDVDDAYLLDVILDVHAAARGTYGTRRVHAELRLGRRMAVGRRRVERLMRCQGLAGVHRRRWRQAKRNLATWPDLVERRFVATEPDRLWVTDITQHRTSEGWVYAAVVLDVFSRRVVGWSIADHLRTELVVDALDMARWRRKPSLTVVHLNMVNTRPGYSVTGDRNNVAGELGLATGHRSGVGRLAAGDAVRAGLEHRAAGVLQHRADVLTRDVRLAPVLQRPDDRP
jgi:putative transposase